MDGIVCSKCGAVKNKTEIMTLNKVSVCKVCMKNAMGISKGICNKCDKKKDLNKAGICFECSKRD